MQDATGKTLTEIHKMGEWDRHMTALLRARLYKEKYDDSGGQHP